MSLISMIIGLLMIGGAWWAVTNYIALTTRGRKIVTAIAVVLAILVVLMFTGLLTRIGL
jgi:hypothetical protein